MLDISVIIPVYNVEKYIKKNIESLIAQSLENVEYIYVIDGSTDQSEQILDEYCQKDIRIKIIKQKNMGLSAARNTGIEAAEGEYILFVDSDDYLQPECLYSMLKQARKEKLDLLQGYFRDVDADGNELKNYWTDEQEKRIFTGKECLTFKKTQYAPWLCLIRSVLIERYHLRFAVGLYHEDMEFVPRMFYYADRVQIYNDAFYNRTIREGSITHTKNIKRCRDLCVIANMLKRFAGEQVDDATKNSFFNEYVVFLYSSCIHVCVEQNLSIRKFMSDRQIRMEVLAGLKASKQMKYRLQYMILKYKLYEIYQVLYLVKKRIAERFR